MTITATAWYEQVQQTQPVEPTWPITTVRGADALSSGGMLSYFWKPENDFYYIKDDSQMHNYGFKAIYDWAATSLVMYYDTWRARFDYDGTEWMIQAWKGQYGFLYIGGEIGVYTREPGERAGTSTGYNCADFDHLINMEMTIHYDAHDGDGYRKLFTCAFYPYWWCNGFVDGHLADYKFNDRSCLIMTARLRLYDEEMTEACAAALTNCGFRRVGTQDQVSVASADTFTVDRNSICFSWKTVDQGYNTR